MRDFVVALGLVLVIEGILFAAFPQFAKRAVEAVTQTPEPVLRRIGIGCAVGGLLVVWLIRG